MSTPKTFADFGVEQSICDSLAEVDITAPFPIQEMTLPLALRGADIIGQARTGTGKTLGFGIPMLQRIDLDGGLQSLIIVPTRELCLQVSEDLVQAGKGRGVKVAAVYGGKAMQPQIDAIAGGAHLIVGTPGRLLDLSRRGVMDLSHCHGLVLDEADEMLDLGFLPDVEALVEMCADKRQTLLFSATMPAQIVSLARRYMTKPTFMRAEVEEITIAPETTQYFFSCHRMDKPAVLARILTTPDRGLCVVFCRTKRMADILAEELRDRDVKAQAIHSDLRQEARERALQKFRDGKTTVLCATEVAARGLDIDDVTHVVNYDCPDDHKMYLHRIGRTGRAGADGVAITFAVWNELPRLEMIRRDLDIDEEIHEVFSTSPLLDELFDLQPAATKKKTASTPQPRSGKPSRSRRNAASDQPTKGRRSNTGKRAGTTKSAETVPSSVATTSEDRSTDQNGSSTRTRRRTKTVKTQADTRSAGTGAAADSDSQARDQSKDDKRGTSRTRDKTKRRGGSATSAESATSGESDNRNGDSGRGRSSGRSNTGRSNNSRSSTGRSSTGRSSTKRGNDKGGGSRRRETAPVDSETARGDGQPRLTRKLEVQHLP